MRKEVNIMDGIVGMLLGGFFAYLVAVIMGWMSLPF